MTDQDSELTLIGNKGRIFFTPEQTAQVENLAAQGTKAEIIANSFGIDYSTFLKIQKRQPEVRRAYKKGFAKLLIKLDSKFMDKCFTEGDTASLIYIDKTRNRWFNTREEVKLNVSKASTPMDMLDTILLKLRKGELTIQEANQLGGLASLKANIINNQPTSSQDSSLKIDNKDELITKINVIQKILDNQQK